MPLWHVLVHQKPLIAIDTEPEKGNQMPMPNFGKDSNLSLELVHPFGAHCPTFHPLNSNLSSIMELPFVNNPKPSTSQYVLLTEIVRHLPKDLDRDGNIPTFKDRKFIRITTTLALQFTWDTSIQDSQPFQISSASSSCSICTKHKAQPPQTQEQQSPNQQPYQGKQKNPSSPHSNQMGNLTQNQEHHQMQAPLSQCSYSPQL
ncbi:hypothetical protein Cgig2_028641 [Carnegiea gigantea]|uniref:Uncharacterized protein n=1 Tax=Carnegiea gigantea TaxID=171969 RepID=A0A9Q1JX65_9CARY|nr:hypothetical protein Cgig2_028641 [Carnegiea gigantea]